MKNLWISHKNAFVTWKGGYAFKDFGQVLEFWQKMMRLGEELEVFKVRASPLIDYEYERDGFIGDYLSKRYAEGKKENLMGFHETDFRENNGKRQRIYSKVAYYNKESEIEEGDIDDVGALLSWLRPEDADEDGFSIWMRHYRPVEITSWVWDSRSLEQKAAGWGSDDFVIELHTDIWFPWVYGMNEENSDTDKRFSNHELARRHTPRLNEFIRTVRQATLDMGGKWEIDTSETHYTRRSYVFMLSDEGINLDAPLPAEYSENHTLYFG